MSDQPTRRRVLITGCDSGLGRAFALHYAALGWEVHASYRDIANAIAESSIAAHHPLDVCDDEQVAALHERLRGVPLHLLVSNAGLASDGKATGETDFAYARRLIDTNTLAPLRLVEALLDSLVLAGRSKLALISSRLGSMDGNITGGHIGYRASKAALNSIGRTLAVDLFARGVVVVMLHPGWVRTANGGGSAPLSAEESVAAMAHRIEELGSHETGQFMSYAGQRISW